MIFSGLPFAALLLAACGGQRQGEGDVIIAKGAGIVQEGERVEVEKSQAL